MNLVKSISLFWVLLIGLGACKGEDELVTGPAMLQVGLPGEASVEDGWAVLAVDVLQGTTLTTIYPDTAATVVDVQASSGENLGVVVTAVQTQEGALTWYRGTTELVPEVGSQSIELDVGAEPSKELTVLPSLLDEAAAVEVDYAREFAILFADLETGFITNPLFKTRESISLPANVNLFAFLVGIDVHGEDLGAFQIDTDMLGIDIHDGLVISEHEGGLVAIDIHDGLEVGGEVSIDIHDGMTLNELGIDIHDGLTTAILSWKAFSSQIPAGSVGVSMGNAPTLSQGDAGSTEPASAEDVTPGDVVLQDLEGFPQMDTAYTIECAQADTCESGAMFRSCADSVAIAENAIFQIRYKEVVDLGCVEFSVRIEIPEVSSESCSTGTSCDGSLCTCSDACAAEACGSDPGCGSCGTCGDLEHCALDATGEAACVSDCTESMGVGIPLAPGGACIDGRSIQVCKAGERDQYQCLDSENSDYDCLMSSDGFPVCGDSTCSPSCAELRVGQTDGCGMVCGIDTQTGSSTPCSDTFYGSCHPDGPTVTCVDGSFVIGD